MMGVVEIRLVSILGWQERDTKREAGLRARVFDKRIMCQYALLTPFPSIMDRYRT